MDRTAWIVLIICTAGIFYFWTRSAKRMEELRAHQAQQRAIAAEQAEKEAAAKPAEQNPAQPVVAPTAPAELKTLENDKVRFVFSNVGGGIARAELKEHQAVPDGPIVINEYGAQPIGELTRRPELGTAITYTVAQPDPNSLVFTGLNEAKIKIVKTFTLSGPEQDPYSVSLKVDLTNTSDVPHESADYYLYTGAITPMHPKESNLYLLYNWSDDGSSKREMATWFDGGGFLFFKRPPRDVLQHDIEKLDWAGPCNQFYASIIIPSETGKARFWGRRFDVRMKNDSAAASHHNQALHGGLGLGEVKLEPGKTQSEQFQIYTGPRELSRLKGLGHDMAGLMHYDDAPIFGAMFGMIPFMAKSLLKTMVWLHGMVHNWGVAILLLVCILRLFLWPLHSKSNYTMKRMAKLAPMMTELREKHKDDPARMQQETMKLYKDYGVNPMGGCLPALIQLPIFLGFYKMLQSAVELRHKGFLWVRDLAMPDSVIEFSKFSLFGVSSLNLMPLLMAGTMVLQMAIGPKASDKMQQRILMFMPVIFLFICYNFASALALYWTGQNIFSIVQTWIMNKRPEPELKKRPPRTAFAGLDPRARLGGASTEAKPKKRRPRTGG